MLSFHEAASYDEDDKIPAAENRKKWREEELKNIRWNTLKVLRQLSSCGLKEDKDNLQEMTSIRAPLMQTYQGKTIIPENHHPVEGSSNLFYYLFEDYSAAVRILNSSKKAVERLVSIPPFFEKGDADSRLRAQRFSKRQPW